MRIKLVSMVGLMYITIACAPRKTALEKFNLPPDYLLPDVATTSKSDSAFFYWVEEWKSDSTLRQTVKQVLAQNLQLLQTKQQLAAAEADLLAIKGARLPQLDLVAGAGVRRFGRYTMDGAGNASTEMEPGKIVPENLPDYRAGVNLYWNPDFSKALSKQNQAVWSRILAQKSLYELFRSQWVGESLKAIMQLQASKKAISLLDKSLETQDRLIRTGKLQLETGRGNALAIVQLEEQRVDILEFKEVVAAEETKYRYSIQQICAELPSKDQLSFTSNQFKNVQITLPPPNQLLKLRPDIQAAEQFLLASQAEVEAARRAFWPSLTLQSGVGYQAYNTRLLFTTPASVAFALLADASAPIFNRLALQARYKAQLAARETAFLQYKEQIINALHQVNQAWVSYELSLKQLQLARERISLLEKAERMAFSLFESGKGDYLSLLLIRDQQIAAELRETEAENRYNLARIDLWLACGAPAYNSF